MSKIKRAESLVRYNGVCKETDLFWEVCLGCPNSIQKYCGNALNYQREDFLSVRRSIAQKYIDKKRGHGNSAGRKSVFKETHIGRVDSQKPNESNTPKNEYVTFLSLPRGTFFKLHSSNSDPHTYLKIETYFAQKTITPAVNIKTGDLFECSDSTRVIILSKEAIFK